MPQVKNTQIETKKNGCKREKMPEVITKHVAIVNCDVLIKLFPNQVDGYSIQIHVICFVLYFSFYRVFLKANNC